jgi:YidC/Oxa1 family membrane protein insertase
MAKLKPQLEKIKEKHKDDRAKQNQETMNLFKTHKVNPMSGCLPMVLQMPIWFALYRSLTVSGQLYQAPFISGWIDDLTLPDPYHIMPVLLTGMMFLQTRMTPSTGSGAQQKMLMYGMPIMFGVFSFFFPSGLTLYIFTNTCFTAAHHLYMHKTDPNPVIKVSASESATNKVIDIEETPDESDEEDSKAAQPKNTPKSKKKSSGKGKGKNKPSGKGKGKNKR